MRAQPVGPTKDLWCDSCVVSTAMFHAGPFLDIFLQAAIKTHWLDMHDVYFCFGRFRVSASAEVKLFSLLDRFSMGRSGKPASNSWLTWYEFWSTPNHFLCEYANFRNQFKRAVLKMCFIDLFRRRRLVNWLLHYAYRFSMICFLEKNEEEI
jgi:hypothetical protein